MQPQTERINPNKGGGVISADMKLKLLAFFAAHAPPAKQYHFPPPETHGDVEECWRALKLPTIQWRIWYAQKQLEAFEEMDGLLEPTP